LRHVAVLSAPTMTERIFMLCSPDAALPGLRSTNVRAVCR
jgi:hypothetical protein